MPFRDQDWEDFQRDCSFFPAYTDYLFGVDTRPEAEDEPGLHPQIYDPPPPPPQRQRLIGLPPPVHYPIAYEPVRDATQTRPYTMPAPRPSLLQHESSLESFVSTPTPAPRILPTLSPSVTLLRPGVLATYPQYSFIPSQERMNANREVVQAWNIISSDAVPMQKAQAMGHLKNLSRIVAVKRQEYEAYESARLAAEEMRAEGAELFGGPDQADADTERVTECAPVNHEYAISDISQLPVYVQSRLPQLWACTEMVALQAIPADLVQVDVHRQAQQYLMGFRQSIPPNGRMWLDHVIDGMLRLRKQGGDPRTVLQTMPNVGDALEMGQGMQPGQAY